MSVRIRCSESQVSALEVYVFDPAMQEWEDMFPDDHDNRPASLNLDGDVLTFDRAEKDAVWRFLVNRSNAADETAENRNVEPEDRALWRGVRNSLSALASKVLRT